MDETIRANDDSVAALQSLLSLIIHRWQLAAVETQAYRRVTQNDATIAKQLADVLASGPFVDRLKRTADLRNLVLRAFADGHPQDMSEPLANLTVLLGQTPEALENAL